MTAPRIMILGAGRGQVPLIRSARARGYETVVVSTTQRAYPGLPLADHVVELDITDKEAVLAAAREHRISGIATACADTGLVSLGYVADQLGLAGLSESAGVLCTDKLAMKHALTAAGVPNSAYAIARTEEDLDAFIEANGLPVVVKATDLQGSQGVTIARTREAAVAALSSAKDLSRSGRVLVEQFLEGLELGAQAMIRRGAVDYVLVHDDAVVSSNVPVPSGHSVPSEQPSEVQEACIATVGKAIGALGLDDCAVNVDLMLVDGRPFVIELTGRAGANGLCEIVSHHFDVDYTGLVAALAMGEDADFDKVRATSDTAVVSQMVLPPETNGTLRSTPVLRVALDEPFESEIFVHAGDAIDGFTSSNDYIAQVITWAPGLHEARTRAESVAAEIKRLCEQELS